MTSVCYSSTHLRSSPFPPPYQTIFRYIKHKFPTGRPATLDYYLLAMSYFENKFGAVLFVVTSDDPGWCSKSFSHKDNVVVVSNSVLQDFAILASCNHTIIDYGTFGTWLALLAGGETVYYNLTTDSIASRVGRWLPNWHSYTYRSGDSPIFDVLWE